MYFYKSLLLKRLLLQENKFRHSPQDSGGELLAAAGIAYRDARGLVFDFHALRCQCATLLDKAGVTPRVVQRTMRHSTLELTG